jgi:hypothetical protein
MPAPQPLPSDWTAALARLSAELDAAAVTPATAEAVLRPIGELLLEGTLVGLSTTLESLAARVGTGEALWRAAAAEAVEQAAARHLAALERETPAPTPAAELEQSRSALEALFTACEALGLELDPHCRARVEDSDERLERRLGESSP